MANGYKPVKSKDSDRGNASNDPDTSNTHVVKTNNKQALYLTLFGVRAYKIALISMLVLFVTILLIWGIGKATNTLQEGYETTPEIITHETQVIDQSTHESRYVPCNPEVALEKNCQHGDCKINLRTMIILCICHYGYEGENCQYLDPHQLDK